MFIPSLRLKSARVIITPAFLMAAQCHMGMETIRRIIPIIIPGIQMTKRRRPNSETTTSVATQMVVHRSGVTQLAMTLPGPRKIVARKNSGGDATYIRGGGDTWCALRNCRKKTTPVQIIVAVSVQL